MNKYLYIIILLFFCLEGCVDNDEVSGRMEIFEKPELSDATAANRKIKEMFEKYNTYCKYEFTTDEYEWDWTTRNSMEYTLAEEEYVPEVLDSLDKWVFQIFPEEFSKKYGPLNVLMVDSLGFVDAESIINWDTWEVEYVYYFHYVEGGELATNYMAIAPVSKRFKEQNMDDLKRWWLSLFVEKMFVQLPYPTKYARISAEGYNGYIGASEDVVTKYAFVRHSRDIVLGNKIPIEQDFGDFVSFIVYTKPSEKEKYYAKNSNIKIKVELMKEYFLENFEITLPEARE